MCAKMNWDRVRRENRISKHGSDWIESHGINNTGISGLSAMTGCTCRKPVGFKGAHKQKCPLSGTFPNRPNLSEPIRSTIGTPIAGNSSQVQEPGISAVCNCLNKAGLSGFWREFLQLQVRTLSCDTRMDPTTRAEVIAIFKMFAERL